MSSHTLLSDLCSIWSSYTEKPKYRCPGCTTRTCSLPCYKKHQQRASCNGKRNPAEYLKKSQLATHAGIDRDYNYLKGIERTIDHAGRETWDRGIGGKDTSRIFSRGVDPNSKLQHYLASNRINVDHAPRGMSRQKSNNTRFSKRGHLMWTVEWIDAEGNRTVQDNCLESSSVDEIYSLLQLEKANATRRKQAADSPASNIRGKKRKRQEPAPNSGIDNESQIKTQYDSNEMKPQLDTEELPQSKVNADAEADPTELDTSDQELSKRTMPMGKVKTSEQLTAEKQPHNRHFYYLLKTGTPSASKVFIPLGANQTLTDSLRDQVVLEYPTIHVLPHPPDSLPPEFLLEKTYLESRQGEERELDEALRKAESSGALDGLREPKPAADFSGVAANKILNMLKRDVTR